MSAVMDVLDETFQASISRFRESLTEKQRRDFQVGSLEEVQTIIQGIEIRLTSQRRQRNMQRISKFLEGMTQLSKVVEVFLNVDCTVAFVWAPIKFVLLAAGTWVETLDRLLDTYVEIGEVLPGLAQYRQLLDHHPHIKVHLEAYYCDILYFHRKALDVFSRSNWKHVFHSSWKTFNTQFGPILNRFKRHRDLLADEKITATVIGIHDLRQSVEDKLDELSRQLEGLHLRGEDDKVLQHREKLDKHRQFVLSKLGAPDYHTDFEKASRVRRMTHSGDWILSDAKYQAWTDITSVEHKSLYINGIPGTGKTILASRALEHLKGMQIDNAAKGLPISVVYFFFKHSQPDKRSLTAFLLSILCQLVFQDEVVLDLVYQKCLSVDQRRIQSETVLQELATTALMSQRLSFVLIDGLDECTGDLETRHSTQQDVIDWLESLTAKTDSQSSEIVQSEDRCVRILICSQRNGFLEERLAHYDGIQLETAIAHGKDIEAYVEMKCRDIQDKFNVEEETRQSIVTRVNSRAKGMFLYAKVVLGNLLDLLTPRHFKRELAAENFPKGLDDAYERVVVHVLENPNDGERDAARQILGWVICAERPLKLNEIQSRFCIDIETESADVDSRLLVSCKQLCGSLVEVGQDGISNSKANNSLDIVHETARVYLLQSQRFSVVTENANMAIFCAQYLSSRPFRHDIDQSEVEKYVKTGYYGFLDYAVANWWKHAKRLVNYQHREDALEAISNHLKPFVKSQSTTEDEVTAIDTRIVWQQVHEWPEDIRDLNDRFPVESRVQLIRSSIEELLAAEHKSQWSDASELYGHFGFKCSKPWCQYFSNSFNTRQKRETHISEHDRPFRCNFAGCYGYQLGFAKETELIKHKARLHTDEAPVEFPSFEVARDIFRAAAKGDLAAVQECVETGQDVNMADKKTFPLFLAAKGGHLETCRYLVDHGARVNAQCKGNFKTALQAAVENDDADLAHLLISVYKADTRVRCRSGETAISMAASRNLLPVLSAFDQQDLTHSRCNGHLCEVALLQLEQELPRCRTSKDGTIFTGIVFDEIEALKILIKSSCLDFNYDLSIKVLRLPLHYALSFGHHHIAEELINSGRVDINKVDCLGSLPLHHACALGNGDLIKSLFHNTQSINTRNNEGETPFMRLVVSSKVSPASVHLFLESGLIDVDEPDNKNGQTALHQVAISGEEAVFKLLMAKACHLNQKDRYGRTPFQIAIESGNLPVVAAFLEYGVIDPFKENWGRETAAMTAIRTDNLEALIRLYNHHPSTITRPNSTGVTPLHCAAVYLRSEIAEFLINHGCGGVNATYLEPLGTWPAHKNDLLRDLPYAPCKPDTILTTPLMLAGNYAEYWIKKDKSAKMQFGRVLQAIFSTGEVDLSGDLREDEWVIQTLLINALFVPSMVEECAKAGYTLPWKIMEWLDTETICLAPLVTERTRFIPSKRTVLAVLCAGLFRLLDVVGANFPLSRAILLSGEIEPGSLNLSGEEQLLMEIYWKGDQEVLCEMIELGFDGQRVLLAAAGAGIAGLVMMLLETRLIDMETTVDESGATACDIANRESHFELAERIYNFNIGVSPISSVMGQAEEQHLYDADH